MKTVCVFCGSSRMAAQEYLVSAECLGREIASRGWTLVYGGTNIGLMGRVADSALEAGAAVVGVIPERMVRRGIAHQGLTESVVVRTMHERKQRMADLADAFVALPGGLGTLEEFLEVLTWGQLGLHSKACALLNVDGFFDSLLEFLDHCAGQRFVSPIHRSMILVHDDPAELLDGLDQFRPVEVDKWAAADSEPPGRAGK